MSRGFPFSIFIYYFFPFFLHAAFCHLTPFCLLQTTKRQVTEDSCFYGFHWHRPETKPYQTQTSGKRLRPFTARPLLTFSTWGAAMLSGMWHAVCVPLGRCCGLVCSIAQLTAQYNRTTCVSVYLHMCFSLCACACVCVSVCCLHQQLIHSTWPQPCRNSRLFCSFFLIFSAIRLPKFQCSVLSWQQRATPLSPSVTSRLTCNWAALLARPEQR